MSLFPFSGQSGETDCVVIGKTTHIPIFVIPGLTRNPVLLQMVMLLDAGSSPAWRVEIKRFLELRPSLFRGNDAERRFNTFYDGIKF